jgi:hypothetical protein
MVSARQQEQKRTAGSNQGQVTDTQEFGCLNDECGRISSVRDVEWYDGKHVIECPHCCRWHELRCLVTPRGAPMQFMIVGLLESKE